MQDSIEAMCKRLREQAEALEERLNVQLEDAFEKRKLAAFRVHLTTSHIEQGFT